LEDGDGFAAETTLVRLDDLQRQPRRGRGVEGIAARSQGVPCHSYRKAGISANRFGECSIAGHGVFWRRVRSRQHGRSPSV
jgi:hypothetical protein